ncbi:hypothetical protein Glove_340g30 [Diversispora epigaea]|uniref:HMG box domain-containing protein n=1 Tax=Diversispora epigaea TaxID=1348612 RepID=A0A397HM58_9GLOM|nr:hypothetical protein Glove_340g30 [Diversispora epigaea]
MSFYCFETRQDRTLVPYPPPEFSQQIDRMSPAEIVDHIIQTNIDPITLTKIEKQIAVPLRQLISPRENRRRRCIPRPQNNFVLYRRNFHAVITKERGHSVAKNFKLISNEAAKNWSEESNEVKQLYELIADCAKKVHDCTYPQYVYQPKHKSSKKGNNTIFREVTMDTCKQRTERTKSDRNSSKNDKSTTTTSSSTSTTPSYSKSSNTPNIKSLTASMTSTMTTLSLDSTLSPSRPSSSSSLKSPQSSPPPPPPSSAITTEHRMSSVPLIKEEPMLQPPLPLQQLQPIHRMMLHQQQQSQQSSSIKEWRWSHYSQSDSSRPPLVDSYQQSSSSSSSSSSSPSSQSPNSMQGIVEHSSSLGQPMSTSRLLPPIDMPISQNLMAGYDKNVWNLVNGFTFL